MNLRFSHRDSDAAFNADPGSSSSFAESLSLQAWHALGQQSSAPIRLDSALAALGQLEITTDGLAGSFLAHVELFNTEPVDQPGATLSPAELLRRIEAVRSAPGQSNHRQLL